MILFTPIGLQTLNYNTILMLKSFFSSKIRSSFIKFKFEFVLLSPIIMLAYKREGVNCLEGNPTIMMRSRGYKLTIASYVLTINHCKN